MSVYWYLLVPIATIGLFQFLQVDFASLITNEVALKSCVASLGV